MPRESGDAPASLLFLLCKTRNSLRLHEAPCSPCPSGLSIQAAPLGHPRALAPAPPQGLLLQLPKWELAGLQMGLPGEPRALRPAPLDPELTEIWCPNEDEYGLL